MNLIDIRSLMERRQDGRLSFERVRADPALAALQWPDDVLRDFIFEHGDHGPFVDDYGHLDLSAITWTLETIPTAATSRSTTPARASSVVSGGSAAWSRSRSPAPSSWTTSRNSRGTSAAD